MKLVRLNESSWQSYKADPDIIYDGENKDVDGVKLPIKNYGEELVLQGEYDKDVVQYYGNIFTEEGKIKSSITIQFDGSDFELLATSNDIKSVDQAKEDYEDITGTFISTYESYMSEYDIEDSSSYPSAVIDDIIKQLSDEFTEYSFELE